MSEDQGSDTGTWNKMKSPSNTDDDGGLLVLAVEFLPFIGLCCEEREDVST